MFSMMTAYEADRFMAGNCHPLREVAAKVAGDRNVTDLGCGKGIKVKELYNPIRYVGVDCSSELIKIARHDNPDHLFYCADILDWLAPIPDKALEVCVMVSVLEHMPTIEIALHSYNEARRVAKELLVGWHTVPASQERISQVQAELDVPIWQNQWKRDRFEGTIFVQQVGTTQLWSVSD